LRKRLSLDGSPRFLWRRGDRVLPYGLAQLEYARSVGYVVLVEGETDALTLWHSAFPALGLPGSSTWKEAWRHHLRDIERVFIWHEPDRGGDSLVPTVSRDLPELLVMEAPRGIKDPNALWLSVGCDHGVFQQRINALMAAARPASQLKTDALGAEARDLLAVAGPLLDDPHLFDRVRQAIRATGYAGETNLPLLVYVALTSRHLERPLNLAIIAPSASGKNRVVDAALVLVPEDAYYLEKAGSARALIYTAENFAHRVVIVAEADSIPEDGPAASAIRSLAADSYMAYDVVEKDHQTGQFVTRHVIKAGPTGLITTFTRPLPEQMNTRVLTCAVADSQEQTRAVLLAHAASVNGEKQALDATEFLAAQRWIAIAGDHRVTIPFASALAKLVPASHLRMRRDFRQALTVIQSIALLFQRQRQRDHSGRIVATLADYGMARDLLIDVFTAAATGGVTPQVRETVTVLRDVHTQSNAPMTVKALGDKLGLAKDTAWHRVRRAMELGLINNEETRRFQPAKLVPGDALPEERPALPTADELQSFMCSDEPESRSTVQPEGSLEARLESEPTVESAVEPDIQPEFQPPLGAESASPGQDSTEEVERLNEGQQSGQTRRADEADQVYAFALARELGFPVLQVTPAISVTAGEEAWAKCVAMSSGDLLKQVIDALELVASAPGGESTA
jgi:hypothetical protein